MAEFHIAWIDESGNPSGMDLHVTYPDAQEGSLGFNVNNFSFRSGHYASYVDELRQDEIDLKGYEDSSPTLRFGELHYVMDRGFDVYLTLLPNVFVGKFVITSLSYAAIGVDNFEWTMHLKYIGIAGIVCFTIDGLCFKSVGIEFP